MAAILPATQITEITLRNLFACTSNHDDTSVNCLMLAGIRHGSKILTSSAPLAAAAQTLRDFLIVYAHTQPSPFIINIVQRQKARTLCTASGSACIRCQQKRREEEGHTASVAVVGRGEDSDGVLLVRPGVALHDELVRTRDQVEAVGVVELLAYVLPESVSGAARRDAPAAAVVRVGPEQVAHGTLVGDLRGQLSSERAPSMTA